jgi:hypothetical protein
MSDAGARYVDALAAKDTDALLELFAADIVFRGMTPGRFWEAGSPEEVVQNVLYQWFEPTDIIEGIEHVEVGAVVDRERVDYRFRLRNQDGVFAAEQRGYFDVDGDGRISWMHVMCSGFRPIDSAANA